MKIILSPAKKMNDHTEDFTPEGLPVFLPQTEELLRYMQSLSYDEAKKLWACNDTIARQNYARFRDMDLYHRLTPAVLAYDGIAYQYMAPSVFQNNEFDYVREHLRILSAFYGVLKPMDGVAPYRLEMQAKAKVAGTKDLYAYWGEKLYCEVIDDSHVIVNLASKEYSKCIEKYLTPEDTMVTCTFAEAEKDRLVQKGVYCKMARGEMVRYMAEHSVATPEQMKGFDRLGFAYCEELSGQENLVFLRKK